MIGSITPLVKVARIQWLRALIAYAIGSFTASAGVGLLLGILGGMLRPEALAASALAVVALALGAHEWGVVRLPLRSPSRQTCQIWTYRFGRIASAGLWGLDLGVCVSTRILFTSLWLILGLALLAANVVEGALIVTGYGIGRTLLVASGPFLLRWLDHDGAVNAALSGQRVWHRLHGAICVLLALVLGFDAIGL